MFSVSFYTLKYPTTEVLSAYWIGSWQKYCDLEPAVKSRCTSNCTFSVFQSKESIKYTKQLSAHMECYILEMHQVSSAKITINVCCSLHVPTGGSNNVKYYTGYSFSISHLLHLMHNKYILNSFSVLITFCISIHHYIIIIILVTCFGVFSGSISLLI